MTEIETALVLIILSNVTVQILCALWVRKKTAESVKRRDVKIVLENEPPSRILEHVSGYNKRKAS